MPTGAPVNRSMTSSGRLGRAEGLDDLDDEADGGAAAHSMGSRHVSATALTHLVSGALNEAVLAIGEGAVSLAEVVKTTTAMLRALLSHSLT